MLRVNTKPRHKNAPRIAEKSAPRFLQWLRGRECLCASSGPDVWCDGKIEAAHVDYAGDKGMGSKVSDRFAVPLRTKHHRIQHQDGWQTFETIYEIDALNAADAYRRAWPGHIAWERKLEADNG